uniref:Elongator complex protein 4 n=1 Tax=Panagrellus redivivus TaxID=6233 RepID=A0A7E4ZVD5_PANRE
MLQNYPKVPPKLPGVKHTRTANSSSLGADSLDKLLDDGIPFPSIVAVDERKSRQYSRTLTRLFIAEGYKTGQKVVIVSPRVGEADKYVDAVPIEMAGGGGVKAGVAGTSSEELKIAWRFQSAPKIDSSIGGSKAAKFDLAKSLSREEVEGSGLVATHHVRTYAGLWTLLEAVLTSREADIHSPDTKHPVRIVLNEIGSPLFADSDGFVPFLVKLRAFLLQSTAVIMLTYDGAQLSPSDLNTIQTLSDSILVFHPLADANKSVEPPTNANLAGRLEVLKQPRLYGNSLSRPEACDYSYKESRHTIEIRKLHLDPEGEGFDTSSVAPLLPEMQQLGVLADDLED